MSTQTTIQCPNCGTEIKLEEAIYSEYEKKFNQDMQQKREAYKKAQVDLAAKELQLKKEQEQFDEKLQESLQLQLKAREKAMRDSISKELLEIKEQEEGILKQEIEKKNKELLTLQSQQDQKLQEALQQSKKELETQIKQSLEKESASRIEELESALSQKSKQIQELEASKAEIAKLKMEKEEIAAEVRSKAQIEFYEKLAAEKQKTVQELTSQNELKLKEADEKMRQLQEQLSVAQQKAQQGSMQTQGEVQELAIEEYLATHYPLDTIEEIKKGQRGADCLQIINTQTMSNCAKIYYESKRTKDFQKSWIEKFKADMREKGADFGVLVTTVLPKELERMGFYEGVWVCTFDEFKGSTALIRQQLIQLALSKLSQEGKSDKMSLLYNYLTSNEFAMHIEAITEGFSAMQSQLDKEKRAMARLWKEREKQIEKVLDNTIGMYGSIKGIAGNAIGNVKALELEYIEDEEEE
ncbi:DUF2130 domain-containing protein [Sulfurimonas paralvinellae]|uniref:DUF2130 domain-containing protein n=1 Tax=Sulfurimonas paralvinellae TaxID=317658 RepID=A0A7M1BAU9_9BACT|nr:DUF2130 domain-containing protein [Sulfurimonas paralvinellae]QOP46813.1 DUF2130 domain-containing protein [Sulfurimonas paralvinellae]